MSILSLFLIQAKLQNWRVTSQEPMWNCSCFLDDSFTGKKEKIFNLYNVHDIHWKKREKTKKIL